LLNDAQMAGLVKLRCSAGRLGELPHGAEIYNAQRVARGTV